MMNVYNGFDALNDQEYDALMTEIYGEDDLQQEIADAAAEDYFENELAKDAEEHGETTQQKARYQLIAVWDDGGCKTENSNDFIGMLEAAAIYITDSTCCHIAIYDWKTFTDALNWNR